MKRNKPIYSSFASVFGRLIPGPAWIWKSADAEVSDIKWSSTNICM